MARGGPTTSGSAAGALTGPSGRVIRQETLGAAATLGNRGFGRPAAATAWLACPRDDVLPNPDHQVVPVQFTGGYLEHHALGLIDAGLELEAVQDEERLEGCMTNRLVAIDKRVLMSENAKAAALVGRSG